MKKEIRTRFAPSPTGYMHIGNLRTALYEYLIAKKQGGKFILRIEDTDQERLVYGAIDVIYNTLEMAGLKHDEGPDIGGDFGPYIQSQRKNIYLNYAKKLIELDGAYYCFCSKERLAKQKETQEKNGMTYQYDRHCLGLSEEEIKNNLNSNIPYVIRQKMPRTGTTSFEDVVYGKITIENSLLEDQILIKSDGFPTYNFANVIDDHLMEITHVVRGNEYLSSTPKYNLIYNAFGWKIPIYVHVSMINNENGRKLSKRSGDPSFEDLISMGYLVEAVVNYVALLGWSPGNTKEIFTLKELEESFEISGISKSPAIFDINKLNWMNGEYLKNMPLESFHKIAYKYYDSINNRNFNLLRLSELLKTRVDIITQIPENVDFFKKLPDYDTDLFFHKKMKSTKETSLNSLEAAIPEFEKIGNWDFNTLHDMLMQKAETMQIKNGQLLWPIRVAITGKAMSPGGAIEIAEILGKEETLKRLKIGYNKLYDIKGEMNI